MMVGLIGQLFRALSRIRRSEGSVELDHVGAELLRLEARRAQRPTSSR